MRVARAARLFFLTRPIKFLIYGVDLAVPVVNAKTPYWAAYAKTTATATTTPQNNDLISSIKPGFH